MSNADQKKYIHVGKVMDAHGIRGDIYCHIFSGDNSWVENLKEFILKKNSEQSFKVIKIKKFKKGFIAQLELLQNRNQAEELKGAELWVSEDIFISNNGEALFLREILHFELVDEKLGAVGVVADFSSNGVQDLLIVQTMNKTYEIPFVKDFVKTIEFDRKVILTNLPEGLLEINNED